MLYNCEKQTLIPPKNFIKYNNPDREFRDSVSVDKCISGEIEQLWSKGIKTCGCCCGHGKELGFIQVEDECVDAMKELGYIHYIYPANFGGIERKDTFIPKSYGHTYKGYSERYLG